MIREGVAAADLRRIRTQIEASFLFQDETVLDLAMKLARFEAGTPGGYRTLADVLPTYASIKKRELKEVAAKYFNFDRATVAWALPAAPPAAAAPRRRPAAKKSAKKAAKKAAKKPAKKAAKKAKRSRRAS